MDTRFPMDPDRKGLEIGDYMGFIRVLELR